MSTELMDSRREQELMSAVADAISIAKQGIDPSDALARTARERDLNPDEICRAVEGYNKSKAVYEQGKQAAAGGGEGIFPIADARRVLRQVWPDLGVQKSALGGTPRPAFRLPSTVEEPVRPTLVMDKRAAVEELDVPDTFAMPQTDSGAFRLLDQYTGLCTAYDSRLMQKVAGLRANAEKQIESFFAICQRMPPHMLKTAAQCMVNAGIPLAIDLFPFIEKTTGVPVTKLAKTANAAILPLREPYVTMNQINDTIAQLSAAEDDVRFFRKQAAAQAGGMLSRVIASAVGSVAGSELGQTIGSAEGRSDVGNEETNKAEMEDAMREDKVLDPVFVNQLRGIDAKRGFMSLALYDPDLSKYPYRDLVKAYNDSVQTVPSAVNNSFVLRNLMANNLATGGRTDMFGMGQMAKLDQDTVKTEAQRQKFRDEEAKQSAEAKTKAGELRKPAPTKKESDKSGKPPEKSGPPKPGKPKTP